MIESYFTRIISRTGKRGFYLSCSICDQCLLLITETLSDSVFEHWNRGRHIV